MSEAKARVGLLSRQELINVKSAGPGGHRLLSELSVGNHQSFTRSISGFSTKFQPYGF